MNEQDSYDRRINKEMQFLWNPRFGSDEIPGKARVSDSKMDGLFTHVLYDHYSPPNSIPALYYHSGGNMKDPKQTSHFYAKFWIDYFEAQAKSYQTTDILIMWGDDFSHYSGTTYDAMDIMMKGIGEVFPETLEKYEIVYSTITDYFNSVRLNAKKGAI